MIGSRLKNLGLSARLQHGFSGPSQVNLTPKTSRAFYPKLAADQDDAAGGDIAA
jgi:hypothetical protein